MVDERGDASSIDHHPLVPGWLVRLAAIGWRVLVTLALGVVLFGIAGQLATVAASIILGLILAATLAPYVTERRARGWGAAKAAGVVMLAALLVLGAVVAAVDPRGGPVDGCHRRGLRCGDRGRSDPADGAGRPVRSHRVHATDLGRDPGPGPGWAQRLRRRGGKHRDDRHPGRVPDLLPADGRRQGLGVGARFDRWVAT